MKYQIAGAGWAVGQHLIPAGTVIDSASNDDWSRLVKGRTPPLPSTPLDDEAYAAMQRAYTPHLHKFYGITDPRAQR
jgi:hypothetical protein